MSIIGILIIINITIMIIIAIFIRLKQCNTQINASHGMNNNIFVSRFHQGSHDNCKQRLLWLYLMINIDFPEKPENISRNNSVV